MSNDVFEIVLPEGAMVRKAETPEEEELLLLGSAYQTPSPGPIFGGADVWSAMSADGWLFVVYCGERPGKKFGTHAFRVWPDNGHIEWVDLPTFTELRSTTGIEPNGAFVTFTDPKGQRVYRQQLPLYRTPGFPNSGQTAPNPPSPAPTPTPQPAPGTPVVDEEARAYTSAVKKELKGDIAKLDNRLKAVEARPVGGSGGLSREEGWQLAKDSVFADLEARTSGIARSVAAIAREVTTGTPQMEETRIRQIVREELVKLLPGVRITL